MMLTPPPEYGLPMDEAELDRIDMCHSKYYALLEKKRFLAPIGDNPHKILDLGCGTGTLVRRGGWDRTGPDRTGPRG